jgi:hypothetical protein
MVPRSVDGILILENIKIKSASSEQKSFVTENPHESLKTQLSR